jgi:charged multivesicular body protein 2B
MDDIFDESGDEEEQDHIVNQILDEIGIEIAGKVIFLITSKKDYSEK